METVGLIIARLGSKRLPRKNILLLKGKPLISYAINACRKSKHISKVYVSTESDEIADIAREYGAKIATRPKELAEDGVRTQDVFEYFADTVGDFDTLVSVQANSPQITSEKIDEAVEKLMNCNLQEVRSVTSDGIEHGAIWALKRDAIFWHGLSVYFGIIIDDSIDIHTMADLKRVAELMNRDKDQCDNNKL